MTKQTVSHGIPAAPLPHCGHFQSSSVQLRPLPALVCVLLVCGRHPCSSTWDPCHRLALPRHHSMNWCPGVPRSMNGSPSGCGTGTLGLALLRVLSLRPLQEATQMCTCIASGHHWPDLHRSRERMLPRDSPKPTRPQKVPAGPAPQWWPPAQPPVCPSPCPLSFPLLTPAPSQTAGPAVEAPESRRSPSVASTTKFVPLS